MVTLQSITVANQLPMFLAMSIREAREHFAAHPKICRILDTMLAVGLDCLASWSSRINPVGGEAQRIKLSRELAKRSTGKTLYILDEPSTGILMM